MDEDCFLCWHCLGDSLYVVDFLLGRIGVFQQPLQLLEMSLQTKILYVVITCIAVLSAALLYIFVYPQYAVYFPKCIFHLATGLHCPGCGSQRALVALLHGDALTAMHNNLLALILLPFLLYTLFVFFYNLFNSKKIHTKVFNSFLSARTILIMVIAFIILRNIPLYPFTLLAPLD
jgi:hypothetical protein